ncbi:putative intracellular protease/amidase [Chryseobacterium sp. 52]|uniref:nuclear transport factor 2 family protein n=1 Tax=Chryseobacterium sp. 52 TaxID=2035213 RepID=UPI000C18CA1E|nr:nuclear transport factor 2 family protein [Chryseobacterium sp. 52]PIF46267.1 putative intracellular protease/amidase [Chryseobacterium sp. 52]
MKKIFLVMYLFACSIVLFAQQGSSDTELVRAVLTNYIEGKINSDTARLSSAFHQKADYWYRDLKTGKMVIWPIADYVKGFTPGKKLNFTGKIISINIAGVAAQAKVDIIYPNSIYANYMNLLKIDGKWAITNKVLGEHEVRKKVLFITTSHEKLGNSGEKTGFHFGEVAQAYKPFYEAGYDIDFASPKGGKTYHYGADMNNETQVWFMQNIEATDKLFNAMKLSDINPKKYDAVYFAGGHGVMWDLANDPVSEMITRTIYENNGVVGAVCHGPAALTNVKLSNGQFLVQGKVLTSFTNNEEKSIKLHKVVPFLLQDELQKKGGIFKPLANWQANVQVDQRLVTGQNPASTGKLAEEMIRLLVDKTSGK